MLHHHGHEKQLTEAERERLLSEGAAGQGMVVRSEAAAADHRMSQVRLSVSFKDGRAVEFSGDTVEFSEELANLYQPAPGSPEARLLAEVRGGRAAPPPGPGTEDPASAVRRRAGARSLRCRGPRQDRH